MKLLILIKDNEVQLCCQTTISNLLANFYQMVCKHKICNKIYQDFFFFLEILI